MPDATTTGRERAVVTVQQGDTAVVTGAASGIGRALALAIQRRGARLVLADRDADGLAATARETGGTPFALDVADAAAHDQLAEISGAPRLLCLNAGVVSTWTGPPWEAPPEEWRRVLDINLGGVVNGLRTFVPLMLSTGEPHHVLITASLAGLATWPGGGPYAASKHAAVTVAEQAALALADTPITVTVLCPALVRTGMSDAGVDPEAVADAALSAVDDGTFTVVPTSWAAAVTDRGRRLAAGEQPIVPTMTGSG
jgi:NAD(P)-dependent dehydrogenase (short-subunit alcohol dehydrogenase family)